MILEIPEIEVAELDKKLTTSNGMVLLDVRELWELELAKIPYPDLISIPMSVLSQVLLSAIPEALMEKNTEIIVICHHGIRSATVTQWMLRNGWKNVRSLRGGIDAFAAQINPAIGFY